MDVHQLSINVSSRLGIINCAGKWQNCCCAYYGNKDNHGKYKVFHVVCHWEGNFKCQMIVFRLRSSNKTFLIQRRIIHICQNHHCKVCKLCIWLFCKGFWLVFANVQWSLNQGFCSLLKTQFLSLIADDTFVWEDVILQEAAISSCIRFNFKAYRRTKWVSIIQTSKNDYVRGSLSIVNLQCKNQVSNFLDTKMDAIVVVCPIAVFD